MKYNYISSLQGNSGSTVSIVQYLDKLYVLKQGASDFTSHANIFKALGDLGLNVPLVHTANSLHMLMDYIPGRSMYPYLETNGIDDLVAYISKCFHLFNSISTPYDFTRELDDKFNELEYRLPPNIKLPFELHELRSLLPNTMPKGVCHGDFSLDNILYYQDKFYLIDSSHKTLNSWWLDAAKITQDINAHWFIRNLNPSVELLVKLRELNYQLSQTFDVINNQYLSCFMLLRVLPYCKTVWDQKFIATKLHSIWT